MHPPHVPTPPHPTHCALPLLPQLNLVYLRSWSDVGRAEVTCLSGCSCDAIQLDGFWDRQATLTDLATMQVRRGAAAAHRPCCSRGVLVQRCVHAPACGWAGVLADHLRHAPPPGPPQVTSHPECVLQIEVLKETSSGKHLFSVSGTVVSPNAARMDIGSAGQWDHIQH